MTYLVIVLCLFSSSVFALDANQKQVLQSVALAEPSIASCINSGNDVCVADWFNTESVFIVWKTEILESDIVQIDAFAFNLVDGLTAGKRDEWSNFLFKTGACNPSKPNIRAGLLDVWSGTAAKLTVYDAIIELSKRTSRNAERVLATGTGTSASPGTLSFEGTISVNDISTILRP